MLFDRCLTPPQFAKWLGVNRDKVLTWIHNGTLYAINVANPLAKRPQFVIPPDAIERFVNRDAKTKKPSRKKREGRSKIDIPDVVSSWLEGTATLVPSC